MKIIAISDQHMHLPEIEECDLLLVAGDESYGFNKLKQQKEWLDTTFKNWIEGLKAKRIIATAGNHSFVYQSYGKYEWPTIKWDVLIDEQIEIEGLKIYGIPWVLGDTGWAFNALFPKLKQIWDKIPLNTDIILSHFPPYIEGCPYPKDCISAGKVFAEKILEIKPKIVICGHFHKMYGRYKIGNTDVYNVALVDDQYDLKNPPTIINI